MYKLMVVFALVKFFSCFECPVRRCTDNSMNKICGDNWRTYKNQCAFLEDSCKLKTGVRKLFDGSCRGCNNRRSAHALLLNYFFRNNGTCRQTIGIPSYKNIRKCANHLFDLLIKRPSIAITYKDFSMLFQLREKTKRKSFRKCLRSVARFCDIDNNKQINREEFEQCFFLKHDTVLPYKKGRDEDMAMRCVRNVCYCFVTDGNIIVHFPKIDQHNYNCLQVRRDWNNRSKRKEKCNSEAKETAIQSFVQKIEEELFATQNSTSSQARAFMSDFGSMSSVNLMLLWKHDNLDKNSDKLLDNREIENVKRTLDGINKDCTRTILLSCNVNKDLYITANEWTTCFGHKSDRMKISRPSIKLEVATTEHPQAVVVDACPAVAVCTLNCSGGFERDERGCLICKCRDILKFLTTLVEGDSTGSEDDT